MADKVLAVFLPYPFLNGFAATNSLVLQCSFFHEPIFSLAQQSSVSEGAAALLPVKFPAAVL